MHPYLSHLHGNGMSGFGYSGFARKPRGSIKSHISGMHPYLSHLHGNGMSGFGYSGFARKPRGSIKSHIAGVHPHIVAHFGGARNKTELKNKILSMHPHLAHLKGAGFWDGLGNLFKHTGIAPNNTIHDPTQEERQKPKEVTDIMDTVYDVYKGVGGARRRHPVVRHHMSGSGWKNAMTSWMKPSPLSPLVLGLSGKARKRPIRRRGGAIIVDPYSGIPIGSSSRKPINYISGVGTPEYLLSRGGAMRVPKNERGELVKKVMRERGLSLPQASSFVKMSGLY
jgi:hypothetical protein